jgi:hypothetical protein
MDGRCPDRGDHPAAPGRHPLGHRNPKPLASGSLLLPPHGLIWLLPRVMGRPNAAHLRTRQVVQRAQGSLDLRRSAFRSSARTGGRGYQPTTDPQFLELNPIGLVPAVIDGDVVLRESNTIVRYLATKHGRSDLYPVDPAARADVEQWMDWANYETSISLRGAFLGGMLNEPPWSLVHRARPPPDHEGSRSVGPAPRAYRRGPCRRRSVHDCRHSHLPRGQSLGLPELRTPRIQGRGRIL